MMLLKTSMETKWQLSKITPVSQSLLNNVAIGENMKSRPHYVVYKGAFLQIRSRLVPRIECPAKTAKDAVSEHISWFSDIQKYSISHAL